MFSKRFSNWDMLITLNTHTHNIYVIYIYEFLVKTQFRKFNKIRIIVLTRKEWNKRKESKLSSKNENIRLVLILSRFLLLYSYLDYCWYNRIVFDNYYTVHPIQWNDRIWNHHPKAPKAHWSRKAELSFYTGLELILRWKH